MENAGKKKTGLWIAVILIFTFVSFAGYNYIKAKNRKLGEKDTGETIHVTVANAQMRELSHVLELTGEIRSIEAVHVFPKVPGRIIESIPVETGDLVQRGDLIAILEDDEILAKLEEAKAGLESAKAGSNQAEANLELLKLDRERLANLFNEKAIARQKLDHMDAQYKVAVETKKLADSKVKQAQAALTQLNIIVRNHEIRAPISGYIKRLVDKGSMTAPGKPIVQISCEDTLKIVSSVNEIDFPKMQKGLEVEINVDPYPGELFKGEVSIISSTINPATRTGEIEIHLKNDDRRLRPGMFARINVLMGQRMALVIPRDALNRLPGTGSYYVYTIGNEKAELKNIKIGEYEGNYVEVAAGLEVDNPVVIRGKNRLKDGVRVVVQNDNSTSQSPEEVL